MEACCLPSVLNILTEASPWVLLTFHRALLDSEQTGVNNWAQSAVIFALLESFLAFALGCPSSGSLQGTSPLDLLALILQLSSNAIIVTSWSWSTDKSVPVIRWLYFRWFLYDSQLVSISLCYLFESAQLEFNLSVIRQRGFILASCFPCLTFVVWPM